METPVVLFVFNRPDQTHQVFQAVRRARPRKLLVVADGPRNEAEAQACCAAQQIATAVDWPCEVRTHFAEKNLGCKRRMASGLDWVFRQEPEAIILEDDCIPEPTFFRFCEELLDRYRDDERIVHISGDNFQFGQRTTGDSYYFSAVNHLWGWASWRRAWKHFDADMQQWPAMRQGKLLEELWGPGAIADHFRTAMDKVHSGRLDTWDSQWTLACWVAKGLSILPAVNLISNIGFGPGATHTHSPRSIVANLPTTPMTFPLIHPRQVKRDRKADVQTLTRLVGTRNM